jgi:hypothetical protein
MINCVRCGGVVSDCDDDRCFICRDRKSVDERSCKDKQLKLFENLPRKNLMLFEKQHYDS